MRKHPGLTCSLSRLLLAFAAAAGLASGQRIAAAAGDTFLRDYAQTRGFSLGRPVKAQPVPDGSAVLFLRAEARVPQLSLYEFNVATGRTRVLLTPEKLLAGAAEKLSPEEKARRERMRVSVGGFTDFQLSEDGRLILLSLAGKLYVLERTGGSRKELKTGPGTILDPKFSPDGRSVAYVRDHDLYALDLEKQKERQVSFAGTPTVTHGVAEFVAQEEMDRYSGYWWAPGSKHLAYEEADASEVEVWHIADPAKPGEAPQRTSYPRPGKNNVRVRLGIAPVRGGKTVWVHWDAIRYPYLARVDWHKTGRLTLVVQTRDQKELALLAADPGTGRTTGLLREQDPVWLNLDQEVPRWLAEGSAFLWTSERAGGRQLELRGRTGELVRVLVPLNAGYQGLNGLNDTAGEVFFRASPDPTQSHLYRVALTGGKAVPLTTGVGLHSASFAHDYSIYVHQASTLEAMPRTLVRRRDGSVVGELPSVAAPPPFQPRQELLEVGEGPVFHARVIRPREFDARKRYPVLVNVYGGPHANMVQATVNGQLLNQWLADQGFLVVALDGRGTPGRGRDWERAIYQKFGSVPLEDQVAGLRALGARFLEMDLERVGIFGWSFGGYMSALAVLRRPDVFKAGVAGAPVTDWLDYDTHYTERYLGLPDASAAVYETCSLLLDAPRLQRPLLLIHGTVDDNVYFRHTLKLANALFRAGKEFDLLPLPGFTHMVPEPEVTERLWTRIAAYFQKHLGTPGS